MPVTRKAKVEGRAAASVATHGGRSGSSKESPFSLLFNGEKMDLLLHILSFLTREDCRQGFCLVDKTTFEAFQSYYWKEVLINSSGPLSSLPLRDDYDDQDLVQVKEPEGMLVEEDGDDDDNDASDYEPSGTEDVSEGDEGKNDDDDDDEGLDDEIDSGEAKEAELVEHGDPVEGGKALSKMTQLKTLHIRDSGGMAALAEAVLTDSWGKQLVRLVINLKDDRCLACGNPLS